MYEKEMEKEKKIEGQTKNHYWRFAGDVWHLVGWNMLLKLHSDIALNRGSCSQLRHRTDKWTVSDGGRLEVWHGSNLEQRCEESFYVSAV